MKMFKRITALMLSLLLLGSGSFTTAAEALSLTNMTCRFCGQRQIIQAADQTDADNKITKLCACPDARAYQKQERAKETLQAICGADGVEMGFEELDQDQLSLAHLNAMMVLRRKFGSVTIQVADSTIRLKANKDGNLEIERKRTRSIEAEV